jgi:hypothetical protein
MPWLPKKLQNVMAITDVLALLWQSPHNQKRGTYMIPAILALGLATGMALTTAFAFGLLPLLLT